MRKARANCVNLCCRNSSNATGWYDLQLLPVSVQSLVKVAQRCRVGVLRVERSDGSDRRIGGGSCWQTSDKGYCLWADSSSVMAV